MIFSVITHDGRWIRGLLHGRECDAIGIVIVNDDEVPTYVPWSEVASITRNTTAERQA